jgi:hypothetical protein
MASQLSSATVEMAVRLQPVDSAMGVRKTPSEKRTPMPRQVMAALTARIVQP